MYAHDAAQQYINQEIVLRYYMRGLADGRHDAAATGSHSHLIFFLIVALIVLVAMYAWRSWTYLEVKEDRDRWRERARVATTQLTRQTAALEQTRVRYGRALEEAKVGLAESELIRVRTRFTTLFQKRH